MSNIENLDEHRPMTPIYEMTVYKKADGSLVASLVWADTDWIEKSGDSVSERFRAIADDTDKLKASLLEQASDFTEPT